MLTAVKDVVGVLLIAFLLPVWMAVGLGAVVVIVARQLYWWVRSNTSGASRVAAGGPSPPHHPSQPSTSLAPARGPLAAVVAVPGVSER